MYEVSYLNAGRKLRLSTFTSTEGIYVEIEGVEVFVTLNDDGQPCVAVTTEKRDEPVGREWPDVNIWLNDATLHDPDKAPAA